MEKGLKKRPKSAKPVGIRELKGGCQYFSVSWAPGVGIYVDGHPFTIRGKPFRGAPLPNVWKIRITQTGDIFGWRSLVELGIYQTEFPTRTFRYTKKVWDFYKDLVDRQDMEAYKEAINVA